MPRDERGLPDPGASLPIESTDGAESWPELPTPPSDAPNVVIVVLDDVGFAQLGCYGGPVETPNIDRLASRGLRYANFYTCGICSPTRASLLTGRNAHAVGHGAIPEMSSGFRGYNGHIPKEAGTVAEMLRVNGYNTWALGKWHNTPVPETTVAGPFDRWPLGLGFEQFYGFLGGMTSQWEPALFRDNHPVDRPPNDGYHLSEDLADKAIDLIAEQHAVNPSKPFFLWLAFGACHAPHHVPLSYIERYRGRFDHGWDRERELIFERQQRLGLLPDGARIPPANPRIQAWDELGDDERRVYSRQQEVFAGFLDHTDAQIGRVLEILERTNQLDDTMVILVSDNGASADSGLEGVDQYLRTMDPEAPPADLLSALDDLGGPQCVNEYAAGWAQAGNTPFRWFKAQVHSGGVRDPLIISGPATANVQGEVRHQFHHVVDIVPTILDQVGISPPTDLCGVTQMPLHGVSMTYSVDTSSAPSTRRSQHFESLGNRAFFHDGWKAVTTHYAPYPDAVPQHSFDEDEWELYHVAADPSECIDLAGSNPKKLRELQARWWAAAGRYELLPLDSSDWWDRATGREGPGIVDSRVTTYFSRVRIPGLCTPNLIQRSHAITAEITVPAVGAEGILCVAGERTSGFSFYVREQTLVYWYSYLGNHSVVRSKKEIPLDCRSTVGVEIEGLEPRAALARLTINGEHSGEIRIPLLAPVWFSLDAPFEIGRTSCRPIVGEFNCPFEYSGDIHRVVVECEPPLTADRDLVIEEALRRQ